MMACKGDGDTLDNLNGEVQTKSTGSAPTALDTDGPYSDPVYKKISRLNGDVNRLSKFELQKKLMSLDLDHRGVKEVLKKRLKNYYKRKKLMKAKMHAPSVKMYDYIAVIDFEATCEENNRDYQHEIIEFPIVLIDMDSLEIVSKFRRYVKPVVNPILTPFCTQLTGIKQSDVDSAATFPVILELVTAWLKTSELGDRHSFAVLTDGPWDMYRFMYQQCELSQVAMPMWSKRWINVRKAYHNFYHCQKGGLETMLKNLGLKFEGSPHCGLDDSINIARIAINMLKDGCALTCNEYIDIQYCKSSGQTQVRFEALLDERSREEKEQRNQKADSTRESIVGDGSDRRTKVIEEKMKDMCFKSVQEQQQEENIDDFITFFKSHKSPKM